METKNEALELAQIIDNDGKGCKCRAYSSSECACGAIWTEPSMKRISAMLLAQAAEIEKLRESYQSACLLVADMHEAAMGGVMGPVLGVVEDVAASRTEKAGWVPLFTRPAPATETVKPPENCGTGHCSCIECVVEPAKPSAGEREALIECLREHASFKCIEGNEKRMVLKAADMLTADALEIEQTCNCRFVGEINTVQCTLHNAWAETLNEQSGYRKELHTLKAQQVAVPQVPVAWYEFNESVGGWFLAYSFNPLAKTRPLVFGDAAPQPPQGEKS